MADVVGEVTKANIDRTTQGSDRVLMRVKFVPPKVRIIQCDNDSLIYWSGEFDGNHHG